jgi:hypothetical protein
MTASDDARLRTHAGATPLRAGLWQVDPRYSCIAHGVGICDEWPRIAHRQDCPRAAYDGELAPGRTMCVEGYIGLDGGREGVKLEQQVLITERGCRSLSTFAFEDTLAVTFVD